MLVIYGLPQLLSRLGYAPVLAAPLLLIGLAYLALQIERVAGHGQGNEAADDSERQ
jgi:hypothetical protein